MENPRVVWWFSHLNPPFVGDFPAKHDWLQEGTRNLTETENPSFGGSTNKNNVWTISETQGSRKGHQQIFGRSHRLPHTCTKMMYIRQNGKGTVWHNLQRGSRYFGQVPSLTSCLHNFKNKHLHVSYYSNVVNPKASIPFGNGLYKPFMVIFGVVSFLGQPTAKCWYGKLIFCHGWTQ